MADDGAPGDVVWTGEDDGWRYRVRRVSPDDCVVDAQLGSWVPCDDATSARVYMLAFLQLLDRTPRVDG